MLYSYGHNRTLVPSTERFALHTHETYELFYFLEGQCDYVVEGAVYHLEPHDLIFISPGEMHRVYHRASSVYDRIIVNIDEKFFDESNCREYLNIFINREKGTQIKISSEAVIQSGIRGCFERLEKYTGGQINSTMPVVRSILVEVLYLMNNSLINNSPSTNRIQKVISYINSNFAEDISLSNIAEKFFVSSSHLSREFHTATGHTLSSYINKKRLADAIDRINGGANLFEAATNSGFGDYTSFYRTFCKEYGCSPKSFFKKH